LLLFALGLSIVGYLVIENPVRHASFLVSRRWATIGLGACLVGAALGVTLSANQKPYQQASTASSLVNLAPGSDCPPPPSSIVSTLRQDVGLSGATTSTVTPPRQIMLVGDSTACTMLSGLQALAPHYGFQVIDAAVVGCGVVTQQPLTTPGVDPFCAEKVEQAETSALQRSHPSLVLWSSQWERDPIVVDTPHGLQVLAVGTPAWKSALMNRLEERVSQFTAHGAKVVLLTQAAWTDPPGVTRPTARDESYIELNSVLTQFAEQHKRNVFVVNLASHVCPGGPPCSDLVGTLWVRPDGLHYGPSGSLFVARWLLPRLITGPLHLPPPPSLQPTVQPGTEILVPSDGATVSGDETVIASANDKSRVKKMNVYLRAKAKPEILLGTATPTLHGWTVEWNTRTVPNGTYELGSVIWDAAGAVAASKTVTVQVAN
jgi:hypothetical protein